MATLREQYYRTIQPALGTALGDINKHAAPRMTKITINVGSGELKGNESLQKSVAEGLALMTGQKPIPTRARKSIAGFKLRENDIVGYKVTLRGQRMYDFLDRLITYVFPRLRDFQGLPTKGFDRQGNYSFGFREHTVFPEIPFDTAGRPWSLQVTISTTTSKAEYARMLLEQLGFPFAKPKQETK